MSADKVANYTAEQTIQLLADYANNIPVETIANNLGKSTRSIIAKLSREGVYKKKEYITKTGNKPEKKDNLADKIGNIMGFSEGEIESLAKANKTVLQKLYNTLANM